MTAPTPTARRRAREVAFRLAYQADVMAEAVGVVAPDEGGEGRLSDDQKALVEALSRFLGHAGSKLLERVIAGTLRFRLLRGRPCTYRLCHPKVLTMKTAEPRD